MIDVWLQHSIYADYPIWRLNMLHRHRNRFAKIILYPSDHNREKSFKNFLYGQIKETWCEPVEIDWSTADWRQAEIEPMFQYSDADWVYFTEQDFFAKDYDKFYDKIESAMPEADAVGLWNPTNFPYLHPSSFFIRREILEKTQKDFRAHPEIQGCDHFAMLTRDLERLNARIVTYQDLGLNCDVTPEADCFHLGGLTSNIIDSVVNSDFTFHRPEAFASYNYWSRQIQIAKSMEYLDLSSRVESILKEKYPEIKTHDTDWDIFFK